MNIITGILLGWDSNPQPFSRFMCLNQKGHTPSFILIQDDNGILEVDSYWETSIPGLGMGAGVGLVDLTPRYSVLRSFSPASSPGLASTASALSKSARLGLQLGNGGRSGICCLYPYP